MVDEALIERLKDEQKIQRNPNYLFCQSLVAKLDALSADQQEIVQIEILQVLRRARASERQIRPLEALPQPNQVSTPPPTLPPRSSTPHQPHSSAAYDYAASYPTYHNM